MAKKKKKASGNSAPNMVSFGDVRGLITTLFDLANQPPELEERKKYAMYFLKLFPKDFTVQVPDNEPDAARYAVITPPKPWG
ncbi:MAG TPA: hypothetical protein VIC59_03720 [Gemmatimonadota bacterium]|jgi:hypothetical protein